LRDGHAMRTRDRETLIEQADATLLDLVDNLLNRGAVVTGAVVLAIADVDLVDLRLSVLLCAAELLLPPEPRRRGHGTSTRWWPRGRGGPCPGDARVNRGGWWAARGSGRRWGRWRTPRPWRRWRCAVTMPRSARSPASRVSCPRVSDRSSATSGSCARCCGHAWRRCARRSGA